MITFFYHKIRPEMFEKNSIPTQLRSKPRRTDLSHYDFLLLHIIRYKITFWLKVLFRCLWHECVWRGEDHFKRQRQNENSFTLVCRCIMFIIFFNFPITEMYVLLFLWSNQSDKNSNIASSLSSFIYAKFYHIAC